MTSTALTLLKSRRLLPMFVTQAMGAFIDNLVKNALVILVLAEASANGPVLVALASGAFILPYMLCSPVAGQIADRHDKAKVVRVVKVAELALMMLAAVGFLLGNIGFLFVVLFGLGVQASFFGPLKYAILPDHLRSEEELVAGNGLIEAGTFLSILLGTTVGGALILIDGGPLLVSAIGILLSIVGLASGFMVPPAPPSAQPQSLRWNFVNETVKLALIARVNRPVWSSIVGIGWFWVVGAVLLSQIPVLVMKGMDASSQVAALFLAIFSISVGAGSIACARILKGRISTFPVPFAAIGIAAFTLDFAVAATNATGIINPVDVLTTFSGIRMLADLFMLSACGGIFSMPLYSILQKRSAPEVRARMVALNNISISGFLVATYLVVAGLSAAGMGAAGILVLTAASNLAVAVLILFCRNNPS